MWPPPCQQVLRPASFYLKRVQLFISASLTSLGEVAAVHILSLSLSLEDMPCVSVSKIACVCVFVCGSTAVLDVHHLSFPVKAQHLEKYNSLYTVSLSSLPSCPIDPPVVLSVPFFCFSGLYYVDSEGNRVCGDLFAVGSGSMYAYGVMDSGVRHDLTVEEACELGRRAIYQATYRDAYSGGQVNLYHVHSEGWTRISQDDVLVLHHQYKDQA